MFYRASQDLAAGDYVFLEEKPNKISKCASPEDQDCLGMVKVPVSAGKKVSHEEILPASLILSSPLSVEELLEEEENRFIQNAVMDGATVVENRDRLLFVFLRPQKQERSSSNRDDTPKVLVEDQYVEDCLPKVEPVSQPVEPEEVEVGEAIQVQPEPRVLVIIKSPWWKRVFRPLLVLYFWATGFFIKRTKKTKLLKENNDG